jgi:hypothetical protein
MPQASAAGVQQGGGEASLAGGEAACPRLHKTRSLDPAHSEHEATHRYGRLGRISVNIYMLNYPNPPLKTLLPVPILWKISLSTLLKLKVFFSRQLVSRLGSRELKFIYGLGPKP